MLMAVGLCRMRLLGVLLALVGLTACGSHSFFEPKDGAPRSSIHPDSLRDAVPRRDPVTRAGNKNPYTVLGKTYHLLPTSEGYQAEGVASWYGTKFHGRPTANGEKYSLYGMTAAHKTLPIPAYVKVTNLENGRTAVVRINDRGPFHDDRLIDLSYAAAVKLGYADKGTARVRVEVVHPESPPLMVAKPTPAARPVTHPVATAAPSLSAMPTSTKPTVSNQDSGQYYLQVGAFKNVDLANRLRAELILMTNQSVTVASNDAGVHRVQVGPLDTLSVVQALTDLLVEEGHGQPRLVSN